MKGKSTISTSPESDFARDDAPRLTRELAERAELAMGGHVIREARPRGRPPKAASDRKEAVSLRLSPTVLAYFRSTGAGWQTRIDEALQGLVNADRSTGHYRSQKEAIDASKQISSDQGGTLFERMSNIARHAAVVRDNRGQFAKDKPIADPSDRKRLK